MHWFLFGFIRGANLSLALYSKVFFPNLIPSKAKILKLSHIWFRRLTIIKNREEGLTMPTPAQDCSCQFWVTSPCLSYPLITLNTNLFASSFKRLPLLGKKRINQISNTNVRDYHYWIYAHFAEFTVCVYGMENFTIKKGSSERLEESVGLELDIHSLLPSKSMFWHHLNHETNNTRC